MKNQKAIANFFSPDELAFAQEFYNEYSFDQLVDDYNLNIIDIGVPSFSQKQK